MKSQVRAKINVKSITYDSLFTRRLIGILVFLAATLLVLLSPKVKAGTPGRYAHPQPPAPAEKSPSVAGSSSTPKPSIQTPPRPTEAPQLTQKIGLIFVIDDDAANIQNHTPEVVDAAGQAILGLTRRADILWSSFIVNSPLRDQDVVLRVLKSEGNTDSSVLMSTDQDSVATLVGGFFHFETPTPRASGGPIAGTLRSINAVKSLDPSGFQRFLENSERIAIVFYTNRDASERESTNDLNQLRGHFAGKPTELYTVAIAHGDSACLSAQRAGARAASAGVGAASRLQRISRAFTSICRPNFTELFQKIGDGT